MNLNPIQSQEKITGNRPTKAHHRLMTENLHEASKISGEIHKSNLYPTTYSEHEAIICYLAEQNKLRASNHQFDTENGYFVSLFGPRTHVGDENNVNQIQITRQNYEGIKKIMAEQNLLPSPNQDDKTITGNCNKATKIATQNQVREKNTGNETITGNCNEATKIATQNQVCEKNKGNCKEVSDIGTSGHIKDKGLRRSPQVKGTGMKIDDLNSRANDDSEDSDDNDANYIPEDDSSIAADNLSEDTPSCPKKREGKRRRKSCPRRQRKISPPHLSTTGGQTPKKEVLLPHHNL